MCCLKTTYFSTRGSTFISTVGFLLVLSHPLNGGNSTTDQQARPGPAHPETTKDQNETTFVIKVRVLNNTVRAWSSPSDLEKELSPPIFSPYSAPMLSLLVSTYHNHSSTNDPLNEVYYTKKRIGDNVWFNVERVAPFKMFMNWAINTSKIMNRLDQDGNSLIKRYITSTTVPCSPETAFHVAEDIIMADDKSRRTGLDKVIGEWVRKNNKTPPEHMCNKYRGLTCNPVRKKCECENSGNTVHYVPTSRTEQDKPGEYRDGCYAKPWKKCSHLSLDMNIPAEYKSYHAHPDRMKQFLLRLATPLPRMARCEKGTYCVDMIVNQRRPICWCSSRMYSKDCFGATDVPLLQRFLGIRKHFHEMIIPERDKTTKCALEPGLDDKLKEIIALLENVQQNYRNIVVLMREVIGMGGRGAKICDFRKGLSCDPYRKICVYKTGCGPGRVVEEGMGFGRDCRINNGYPCPSIEMDCVIGAECKDFGQGRHCHCSGGKYGDMCRFKDAAFFGSIIQSRISGFVGYHFTNLQELANHVLKPVERLMTLTFGKKCNPNLDSSAMTIVRYMGGVRSVNLERMDETISAIQYLVGRDEPLCNYRRFLGCTDKAVCEPMIPDVVKYEVKQMSLGYPGRARVFLSLKAMARCSGPGNYSNIPPIYHDIIHVQCLPHQQCRRAEGKTSSKHKYCLCPAGYQGVSCDEKIRHVKNVEVRMRKPRLTNNGKEKHLHIIRGV